MRDRESSGKEFNSMQESERSWKREAGREKL
jgi:hypothetical protein